MEVIEERRQIPVAEEADVVVCGGGPAGLCAAIAAARQGMKTVIIEHNGFLGGTITAAGVNGIGGWQHDLDGRVLIGGIARELMETMAKRGGANPEIVGSVFRARSERPVYNRGGMGCLWIGVNPDILKIVADDYILNEKIVPYYHADAVRPIMESDRIRGVFIESKSGREAILGKVVIDCTGDGDIAYRAGAQYEMGRDGDDDWQPHSMLFTVGNTGDIYLNYDKNDPESDIPPLERQRYRGAVALARENGEIVYNPNDIFCAATPVSYDYPSVKTVNFTRVQHLSGVDVRALTQAEIIGRKQVEEAVRFMKKYVRGGENTCLLSILPSIGIRESRRIRGEYYMTKEDISSGRRFDDAVMRGIYLMDIHNAKEIGKPSVLELLDQPYDIPYRSLIPLGVEQLLVAGRCISGDSYAHSSYRIQSHCMALGEAAGIAAALAVKSRRSVRSIDVSALQDILVKTGGNIGK